MMRGSKRPAISDFNPNPADSSLGSKRVLDEPSFDAKRAESAHRLVRALNIQFASWVQLQLQNHPDELWEDGAKDYVSHASNILEKFKDVVDWLRTKGAQSENVIMAGTSDDHNKSVAVLGNSKPTLRFENSGLFSTSQKPASSSMQNSDLSSSQSAGSFAPNHTLANSNMQTSGFSSPQTSGFFGFSQTPASSSSQSSSLFSSQSSGLFGFSQTPASLSLQSSSLSSAQSSGLFGFSQMPASLSSSQSSGLFGFSQTPASSNLQSMGSSSQSSSFFSFNQKPGNSSLKSSGLSSSQSSGFLTMNQTTVFGGTPSFSTPKVEASEDADGENELEQPTSPSLKKSEEKGIVVVHEVKCKVYVKPDNPENKAWKDMGVGQLSIKCKEGASKAAKESKPTIIIRNDVGKILLNALIYPGIKMNIKKNTIASIFHTSGSGQNGVEDVGNGDDVVTRTYLLRLKTEDETTRLAAAIQDYAPSA